MDPLDEECLGKERGEFVTAGSELERSLAACPQPETEGWFHDPLHTDRARYFNGVKWTGRLRPVQVGGTETPIGEFVFESGKGIALPVTFHRDEPVTVTYTATELLLKGPWLNGQRATLRIARSSILGVTLHEGPPKLAKHSTASNVGAFGLWGLAYSLIHEEEFARQRIGQAVVAIVTAEGALILVTKKSMAQLMRQRLAPLGRDAQHNVSLLPPPTAPAVAAVNPIPPTPLPPPGGGPPAVTPSADETVALLEKVKQLHDAGVLTDAEFAEKKAELLRRL